MDISIIVVSHNCKVFLRRCLESVFTETKGVSYEIFVVDNASSDGTSQMVKKHFPKVNLVQNEENVGFAKANNQAISKSKGRYVLLLNPDTLVLAHAITRLAQFMDTHSDADAAGCKLLNADGSTQHSIGNFPSLINKIAECFFLHRLFPRVHSFGEIIYSERAYRKTQKIDWVFGAALAVRRETIKNIGLLDENFFLFSEEKDWCYRIKQFGKNVYFYPDAQIVHYGRGLNTATDVFTQLQLSKLQFFRKHHGPLQYLIFKSVTVLNIFLRTFIWAMASLLNIRKKSAVKKFKLYREALSGVVNNQGFNYLLDAVHRRS